MKIITKRFATILMALIICINVFCGINFSAKAAGTVDYVYSGKYIYNWGVREEVADFLSPNAEQFYADNNTSYEQLSALSGNSNISSTPSSELYKKLQTIMKSNQTKVTSYGETRSLFQYTDCENSGKTSKKISSFYSGDPIGPAWDSGATWNREHTWPNSKGDQSGDGENDIMMLRPTASSENGSRGNKAYGESTGYYDPNTESGGAHNLHGDVARIMLYQYVRWGSTSKMWGSAGVMESKELLLEWIEEDPVDTWELGRNDSVESITGTRNIFVDYPELIFVLFDESIPNDYETPSGEAMLGSGSSGSSGSETTSTDVGDVNEDGAINNKDLAILMQHLNGWGVTINQKSSDVNGDGNLNNRDYAILMQFINGWDVELEGSDDTTALKLVTDEAKILKDAFALGKNETTPYIAQLTGKVISIDKEYDAYGSVTVTIEVGGKNIQCYNMKGTGTDKVMVGDTITVKGVIKNFYYDEADTSGTVEFTYDRTSGTEVIMTKRIAGKVESKELTVVDAPQVGVAYKFGFFSTAKNATYYAIGGMKGYYMATATEPSIAIDVYLEEAEDGYYLYTIIGGKKNYMNIKSTGTHVNAVYEDAPGDAFSYDTNLKTLVVNAVKNGKEGVYGFGTYGDYTTIGTSATSYDTNYYCHFYK